MEEYSYFLNTHLIEKSSSIVDTSRPFDNHVHKTVPVVTAGLNV